MRRLILSWLVILVVLVAGIIPEAMATKVDVTTSSDSSTHHKPKKPVRKNTSKKNKNHSQTSTN